jgi:putative peptidoglycan lipid II flippase
MVESILKRLSSPVRGLHQAAYLLAALTLASQILALLRDRTFAGIFGAGHTLDLYYAAFKIPDLVFALIASLVSAYVLIPRIAGSGTEAARKLLSQSASFLLIGGGGIAGVIFVAAPWLLATFFPALYASSGPEFVALMRLLLVQPILLGLSGAFGSVTQVHRRFVLFALSPVLYNLGIIAGALVLYPYFGLTGIGFGVIFGSILHVAVNIPVLIDSKLFPKLVIPSPKILWPVFRDSLPRSFALTLGSVTTLALTSLASIVGEGSISVFVLASNLAAVPLSLIGASYATAAFPVLAEEAGAGRTDAFRATLTAAARHLIFWSCAIAVLTVVLRAHIVRVLLGTGVFSWDDTRLTAAILGILALGLVAQGLVLLASRAFYATGRSWNPLIIQTVGVFLSAGAAMGGLVLAHSMPEARFFVESLFRVNDVAGSSVLFIALGATLGQLLMGLIAVVTLGQVARGAARSLVRPTLEGTGAAIIGGAAAYGALSFMGNIASLTTLPSVLAQGVVAGMVGLIAAAAVLVLLENQEFRDLFDALKRIASLKKDLPPQSEL